MVMLYHITDSKHIEVIAAEGAVKSLEQRVQENIKAGAKDRAKNDALFSERVQLMRECNVQGALDSEKYARRYKSVCAVTQKDTSFLVMAGWKKEEGVYVLGFAENRLTDLGPHIDHKRSFIVYLEKPLTLEKLEEVYLAKKEDVEKAKKVFAKYSPKIILIK